MRLISVLQDNTNPRPITCPVLHLHSLRHLALDLHTVGSPQNGGAELKHATQIIDALRFPSPSLKSIAMRISGSPASSKEIDRFARHLVNNYGSTLERVAFTNSSLSTQCLKNFCMACSELEVLEMPLPIPNLVKRRSLYRPAHYANVFGAHFALGEF